MKNGIDTHSSGFTLIELLIVVVILSTLASIVAPNLYSLGDQGKITAANTTVQNIQKKITAFHTLNDHWPTDIDNSWFSIKSTHATPSQQTTLATPSTSMIALQNGTQNSRHWIDILPFGIAAGMDHFAFACPPKRRIQKQSNRTTRRIRSMQQA